MSELACFFFCYYFNFRSCGNILKLNKYFQEARSLFPEDSEARIQEPEKRNKINHSEFRLLPPEFP